MRRTFVPLPLAIAIGALLSPSLAVAQNAPMFTAFGTHGANSSLMTQPLGATDCASGSILFSFNPVMSTATNRYIDVWWASGNTAMCQTPMIRASTTSPVCHFLRGYTYVSVSGTATVSIPVTALFEGCTTDTSRTFYFFDSASTGDNVTPFSPYWLITAQLTATPPAAPVISATSLAGDAILQIPWNANNFTNLGVSGLINVYSLGACGTTNDGGTTHDAATGMDAGTPNDAATGNDAATVTTDAGASTSTPIAHPAASSPISLDTALLGWRAGSYGDTALIAIATVNSSGTVSALSSPVCAQHVHASGFWDSYCAAHGMTDPAACTSYYRGCSVGVPSRRGDLGAIALVALVAGLFVFRRRAR